MSTSKLLYLKGVISPHIMQFGYWPGESSDNYPAYWSSSTDDLWGAHCLVIKSHPYFEPMRLINRYNVIPCLK